MKSKTLLVALGLTLLADLACASEGKVNVQSATNRVNTLDVTITGPAASDISAQLLANGVQMRRDPFSGSIVQVGSGVRCIEEDHGKPLYCYLAVVGAGIK